MFENTFCPSPWFHMRINNDGTYDYCRWMDPKSKGSGANIRETEPVEWFQQGLKPLRKDLLDGQAPAACVTCYRMDSHDKVSGRQRQLLKIGVTGQQFVKGMHSSPWISHFHPDGSTDLAPQDWQIDLGNHCNSGCLYCNEQFSSRLAVEFKKLGMIDQLPPSNWSDDARSFDRFIQTLERSPAIKYLHFIGGETMITPAFPKILKHLIEMGLHQSAVVGFTTNLTVWDDDIVDLLAQFETVHLGASVECFTAVNDYARWPSKISQVQIVLDRWLSVVRSNGWYMQLRITPTILTIGHLLTVHQYALTNGVAVESCNFLERPEFLRPTVLPSKYRAPIISDLKDWIAQQEIGQDTARVINTRNPDHAQAQVIQDARSYLRYLENQPDESYRLPDLVRYLRTMDRSRGTSVFDYLPEYEELFRSSGY